jgi:cardiolipin synthase
VDRLLTRDRHRACPSPPALRGPAVLTLVVAAVVATGCTATLHTTDPGSTASSPNPISPTTEAATAQTGPLSLVTEPGEDDHSIDQLIAGARHTIDLTMYELADQQTQTLLVAAARRGVSVRVLLDRAFGGASVNQAAYSQLETAGVPVRWGPTGIIVHQKTLTVDGSISAVMTGNLTSQFYATTRDFVVVDRDPAAVSAIESVFADDWNGSPVAAGPSVGGLVWSPGAEPALVDLIDSARHSLMVENEEMDSSVIESALEAASRRGVDVEVTMTADPEWDSAFGELEEAGVHVAIYPDSSSALYIHAKVIAADGETVLVGSQDFSTSSLDDNRELGIVTTDPVVVGPVSRTLAADFAGATVFGTPAGPSAPPSDTAASASPSPTPAAWACRLDPEGNCYRAGEYCPESLRGQTVEGSDGQITCEDDNGWFWEPVP